ncbi:MAG TPA: hypothetical protein VGD42_09990 [Lysobacter sp.]
MNAPALLRRLLADARRRRVLDAIAVGGLWIPALAALAWRLGGVGVAVAVFVVAAALLAAVALQRAWRLDTHWLVRELDSRRPDMEDSADLLFAPEASPNALERLQRARLQARLERDVPDLRPRWSTRAIAIASSAAAVVLLATVLWPARPAAVFDDVVATLGGEAVAPTQSRILEQQLRVTPPGYTGQPARDEPSLDARAPVGTRLRWTLRFAPQPRAAELAFHDGRTLPLRREGDAWHAQQVLERSALYRVVLHDAPPLREPKHHRLDAVPDRAPQVRVLEPDRSLSLVSPGRRSWAVAFEASDDHGIAADARLRITLAQGSGENITFREQGVVLRGSGGATTKRFAHRLDLASLGMAVGDDLIVQLAVDDNRTPSPQGARSASLILRWPSELGTETSGLEGMVRKVMPAYFRSQRQIIIDAEALLKEKRRLEAERFLKRSDEIGVDQRILRLRYGQFLGEEAEGAAKPPPTSDDVAAVTESATESTPAHDEPAEAGHDDHGHAEAAPSLTFGQEGAVLEEYGHTHDHAEAATLLDPETRATLKRALDAMWQSETELRLGHPDRALPHAYRALRHIKEVQQASRIYLARVGPELPPIDEGRRMGGDRAGIAWRGDALVPATPTDATLATLWRALDETPATPGETRGVDFAALEGWLRDNESRIADPLSFVAAMESLRAQPDCATCRGELRAQLWPLLARPPAAVPRRDGGDATGRRYLDALRGEGTQ